LFQIGYKKEQGGGGETGMLLGMKGGLERQSTFINRKSETRTINQPVRPRKKEGSILEKMEPKGLETMICLE